MKNVLTLNQPQNKMNSIAIHAASIELRNRAPTLKLFGAIGHRYLLNPTLSESELRAFETRHRLRLPEDFRTFLRDAGNGGAGPFYGLFRLGYIGSNPEECWETTETHLVGVLSEPFPYQDDWNLPAGSFDPPSSLDENEAEAWQDALDRQYWSPQHVNGALPLCEEGCALRDWLVLTGPRAGDVWHDARADHQGLHPWRDANGSRMTFARWYDAWLATSLEGRDFVREPFVNLQKAR